MTATGSTPPEAPAANPVLPLRARLARFERWLDEDGTLDELGALAENGELAQLFEVHLGTLLRRGGPAAEVGNLLRAAAAAALAGGLGLESLAALRRTLEHARTALHASGAWQPTVPPWWEPLPAATTLEELWQELERAAPALEEEAAEHGARVVRGFVAPALLVDLHAELELAAQAGHLALEAGAVGAEGRVTAQRSDLVRFVSGREPALLATVPRAAALVQWMLAEAGPRLAATFGQAAFPPQQAMLARYPAPSGGYDRHFDNPGGDRDNGRVMTLVLYLNPPAAAPAGGELVLWQPGAALADAPALVVPAQGGTAALFKSRLVPHQVRPVLPGPARWALTLWLNDTPQRPAAPPSPPPPGVDELLLAISAPPLPAGTVLFHELDASAARGRIRVHRVAARAPRAGIVCTAYRAGEALLGWCLHHLDLGFEHLLLVFDHLDEPEESALAAKLAAALPRQRLTIWSGEALAAAGWPGVAADAETTLLRELAGGGGSSWAVAARQALGASAALAAARSDELGGAPLDWLLHLDADELFHLEGPGRGGATVPEHLAAAEAAGKLLLRYLDHELLLPWQPASPPRFKLNPRLAAARLGEAGWRALVTHLGLAQDGPRPYFAAYHNGKAAVAVRAGIAAAGVHGWHLSPTRDAARRATLAGPSVLHLHTPSLEGFVQKYVGKHLAPPPTTPLPFAASPLEHAATSLLQELDRSNADDATRRQALAELYTRRLCWSADEVSLLGEAGLVFEAGAGPPAPASREQLLDPKTGHV